MEFKAEGSFSLTFFSFCSPSFSSTLLLLLTASFCKPVSGCSSEVLSLVVVLLNWSLVLFWLLNEGGLVLGVSVVVVVVLWFTAVPVVVVLPSESLDFLLAGSELSATYLKGKRFQEGKYESNVLPANISEPKTWML